LIPTGNAMDVLLGRHPVRALCSLSLLVAVNPSIGRDLASLSQSDHMHRRGVSALAA
jgi:hypothetical protein